MEHVSSVRPTGKFPEKLENLKRWARFPGWNFRTECRVPFTFLVVCTSSRSTVGHRDVPGFKTKWNNFSPIGNSTFAPTEISGFFSSMESASSLRKQPSFRDAPLVFPRNDVWETSAEIPYWWRVTSQIWVVLLIGWKFALTNQKISAVFSGYECSSQAGFQINNYKKKGS